MYALERLAAPFSHGELLQNLEDRPVLRRLGVHDAKLHHLGSGVDLPPVRPRPLRGGRARAGREELGIGPGEVAAGLVGRLVAENGYREAFAAARSLRTSHPGVRFVVIGPHEPEKADALTSAEIASAEADGVLFLGMRDDVDRLYLAMGLYVLASYREGFPRSAMEAAAMGRPVVATDIRGCRQVVDHGRTGLLVPPRDAPALADAIGQLAEDGGIRSRMGVVARARAREAFDDRR